MSRNSIKYVFKNVTAQFDISTRKWHVESNNKEYYFKNVVQLVEHFPELKNIKRIEHMIKLREADKYHSLKPESSRKPSLPKDNRIYKKETCYYCSGAGTSVTGSKCDNCKGKGVIVVMANIY